jgi:hypothetical protein
MKCLDCGIEVNYEWPKDAKKRAAMELVYEGVVCRPCAGDSYLGALLEEAAGADSGFKVFNFRRRKNIGLKALEAL